MVGGADATFGPTLGPLGSSSWHVFVSLFITWGGVLGLGMGCWVCGASEIFHGMGHRVRQATGLRPGVAGPRIGSGGCEVGRSEGIIVKY